MSQPAVYINEVDGGLGVLPNTNGRLLAVVGVSERGTINTPAAYSRVRDLVRDFGIGPMVEAAAHFIQSYNRPVVVVRTGQSTAGSFPGADAVAFTGTGTSTLTVDNDGPAPLDDFECVLEVLRGGTIDTAGITFRWSVDGGRTFSGETALGTEATFAFPTTGGVTLEFGAGTLVAGDRASFRTVAPQWNTTELQAALTALFRTRVRWEICEVVGPIEAAAVGVIDPFFVAGHASGKDRSWVAHARIPTPGETEAAYRTALETAFSSASSIHGGVCAGACRLASAVSGRIYRRPTSFPVAAREQSVSEEVHTARISDGALPGVSLYDNAGNAIEHDETLNPGLDDARFTVLRSWEDYPGAYINRHRLLAPAGSDFELHTRRRVINIAHGVCRSYLTRRLAEDLLLNEDTNTLLESEAREIESGLTAALRAALLAKPKASAVDVSISRTDNVLSTRRIGGVARIVPLGYAESIEIDLGFVNQALEN